MLALLCSTLRAQTVNANQQVTLQGLLSTGNRGSFLAAANAADGTLYLLLNQGDGVRVLKTNAAATTVLAQAYTGATGDAGVALALDPAGNLYVTGTSSSGSLVGTSGVPFPHAADNSTNSFLAKFDSNLNLVFLTFLGAGRTAASSVAATADAVFVTGITFNATFPVTAAGLQQAPASGSSENGFVECFNAAGTSLMYATYLTGVGGNTMPTAIVADSSDDAYVAGATSASGYPTVAALQPDILGTTSGFLTKLAPGGSGIIFSTFVAGNGLTGMALDAASSSLLLSGNVSMGQFPVATVAMPLTSASYQILLRLSLDGQTLMQSVLLVPGTQSLVSAGPGGTAWVSGVLSTPLFPGDAAPDYSAGDSFLLHVVANGSIDQTMRFGGLPANNAGYASLTSTVTAPAVSASGTTVVLPGTITASLNASLLGTQRFDLPLAAAPNGVLTNTLRDVVPASCGASSSCSGTGALLAAVTTALSAPSLGLSSDDLPNLTLRNLGSATANGLTISANGYTYTTNCGATLAASSQCSIALTGSGPGTLKVSAVNAATATATLPTNSLAPDAIVLSTQELDFGIVSAASPAATQTITVTNLSATSQTFTSAKDGGATTAYSFAETASDCASGGAAGVHVLAANSLCHITLGLTISNSSTNDGPVHTVWKIGTRDVVLAGFAQAAALNASANEVDFGTQIAGGIALPRYLYLSNNSTTALAHAAAALSGSSPFSVNDLCPSVLEPKSVCQMVLNYASGVAPSDDAATLNLDQGVSVLLTGESKPSAGVTGSVANPSLGLSASSLTFATPVVVTGVSSSTQSVVVSNTGGLAFALTLNVSGDFTLTNGCPATLAGGASCTVLVGFAPSQPGPREGLLNVTAGSGFAPSTVALSGTSAALLPANNGTLALGQTLAGEPLTAWYQVQQSLTSLTVTSSSAAFGVALVNSSAQPALPPTSFGATATSACSSCWLGVQFLAQTAGAQSASLSLSTVAGGNPYLLTVTATALPVQGLLLTPVTQGFGPVPVNSTSAPATFTLANVLSTAVPVTVQSVSTSGDFAIMANNTGGASCTGTLAATASCFVQVAFAPAATGERSGTLTIVTSGGTVTAALNGFGSEDPGLAINSTALVFNEVPGSIATTQTITFTNTGASTLSLGTPLVSDPSFTVASNCSALAPSSTCSLTVSFTPQPATVAATLSVPVTQTVNGQTSTASYSIALTGAYTSENAGLELVPGQVNFGSNATGALGATREFTLSNLTAKTLNITLQMPRQFPLASPAPCAALAAGAACSFSVSFLPVTGGALTGTVFAEGVSSDGQTTAQTLNYMLGYGAGSGSLRISGNIVPNSPLNFGTVPSGQTATQTVTLTNIGSGALTVRRISSGPPFLSTTNCGAILAAGAACSVMLTYAPIDEISTGSTAAARSDAGTLIVESDAASSPDTLALTGAAQPVTSSDPASSAVLAAYSLSQSALSFANTPVGSASAAQTVTLTNTGTATLHWLGSIAPPDFSTTSTCTTLLPGAMCSISVTFTPANAGNGSSTGVRSGALEIQSDASDSLEFISLIGSTTAAPLTLSPVALSFGNVNLGSGSTLGLIVTNGSGSAVTFTGVSAGGDYSVASGTCPSNGGLLPAGATCSLQVTFTPTVTGTRTGTLSLTTSAATLPLTVALTGVGVQVVVPPSFTLTVSGGSSATVTVKSGVAATYPLLVTPLNGFAGTVALTCAPVTPAPYASCSVLASTLTLNGGAQSSTATINTLTMTGMLLHWGGPVCALWLPLLVLRRRQRRPHAGSCARAAMLAWGALYGIAALCSCGSNSAASSGSGVLYTPAGTYQYQVTASSTSGTALSSTVTLNLIVQ